MRAHNKAVAIATTHLSPQLRNRKPCVPAGNMDALKRPLRIPPEFSRYAEDKKLFELYERMLSELLVARPEDPLAYLHEFLGQKKDDVPRIIVYGPPASGQHTICKLAAQKLKAVHITLDDLLHENETEAGKKARRLQLDREEVPEHLWAELLEQRLKEYDCVNRGWILEGFPRTRKQALCLQTVGIMAKHFVNLEAPDSVLVERYAGKRIDSLTKDVYHLVFAPPKSEEVAARLVEEEGGIAANMHEPLKLHHRHCGGLLTCYNNVLKTFNADQPIEDLFDQVLSFLCSVSRTAAPHTPRVVLLGPTGSGKSLQASQLAKKYHLVEVDCRMLIKRTLASGSEEALAMRPFQERGMMIPDDMVMPIICERLNQLDCMTRGFVLHGFPLNRDQAELLSAEGHQPNRVFFLNIPEDSIKERLTLRRIDPVTGERYHLLFKPPPSQEVQDRLLVHPRYTDDKVLKRIEDYNKNVSDLVDYYTWGQHINADQDPLTVSECLESGLVNPLPKQPPPVTTDLPRMTE